MSSKLIALVIFSCLGISYGAEYDIKTITTIMDAYEEQVDSIKLKYSYETFIIDKKGNREFVKGTFAQKKSEGYILLDEIYQKGKTWDSDKEPEGIIRSYNGKVTRYLEHEKNSRGYHMAALYENHNPKLYKTRENPYYYIWRPNHSQNKFSDLLTDPNGMAKIQGEEFIDGLKTIRINFKAAEGIIDCYLWLLPEKNYLPIKCEIYNKNYKEGKERLQEIHWSEFKELNSGMWFPMNIDLYYRHIKVPTIIKIEEIDISPLTKEDFEFKFPALTHVTDHTTGLLPTLIGQQAPEFCDIKGWINSKPVQLSDLRGKVVLLDFWGYWCGPCLQEMPEIISLHKEFSEKGLVIIAIHDDSLKTIDALKEKLKEISKKHWGGKEVPFAVALDGGGQTKIKAMDTVVSGATTAAYGITGWPTKLLIDGNGKIVGKFHNNQKDRQKLIEMLNVEKPPVQVSNTDSLSTSK